MDEQRANPDDEEPIESEVKQQEVDPDHDPDTHRDDQRADEAVDRDREEHLTADREAFDLATQAKTREFDDAVPQRLSEVRASIEEAHRNDSNEIVMLEAIRLVHSMVGTAGSFGHHQISDTLRVVERVLRAAVDKPGDLLEEHWEMLYIAVDQLNQIHQLENPETIEIELELNIHS